MKLEQALSSLLLKCPLFGSIAANVEYIVDETCLSNDHPTFATDGKKIYYHPECLKEENISTLEYLLGHEMYHIAYRHLERSKNKDSEIWNTAADAVANAFLKKNNIIIPNENINEPWAIDYSVEEVYEMIKQEQKKNPNYRLPKSHDIHDRELEKKTQHEAEAIPSEVGNQSEKRREKLQKEIERLSKAKEKEATERNQKEQKKNLEEMRRKLVNKTQRKTDPSLRHVPNIGREEREVDWQSMLSDSIVAGEDWSYLVPEIEDDILKPQIINFETSTVEILLDTSGSVNEALLRSFLRECKNILENAEMKIGCFDDEFYGFQEVRTEEEIETLTLLGGGDTNFDVAVDAFTEEASNKIIFTDGYANMPEKEIDVIWLVYGSRSIDPPGGTVIPISKKQYNELNSVKIKKKSR